MPVPTNLSDLSTLAASNYPVGTEALNTVDNYVRAHAAFIAQLRDRAINVMDHGAAGDGTTDDTTAVQAALTAAAGGVCVFPAGTFKITAALTVSSDTVIILEPTAIVETATADISHFDCTNKSNVRIFGPGKIKKTGTGTAAYVAGVLLDGASNCMVYGVEFEGMQWSGVYMKDATACQVLFNYVHDHLGTVQDAAAFSVLGNCVACNIENNRVVSSGWHGILVQDADSATAVVPVGTRVVGNDVNGATAYGIAVYELTADDSHTLVEGNSIRNITGVNPTGSGGAGIYVQNSGGVVVTNNRVRNVCTASSNNTLTPAGIGVVNIGTTLVPANIEGNVILDVGMTEGGVSNANAILLSGINVSSSTNGVAVNTNIIKQGAGLTPATYVGIYLNAASNVVCSGNKLTAATSLTSSAGIFMYANDVSVSNIALNGNIISGFAGSGIRMDRTSSYTVGNVSINGCVVGGGGTSCIGLQLAGGAGVAITGTVVSADTVQALSISACTATRVSGGSLTSTGTTAIETAGTCTGGYLDSVYFGASAGKILNGGTGFIIETHLTAVPAAGTWAVGDRVRNSSPAVGQPKAWSCTAASSPGTWSSEGNL